jgi:class 3 adenylate cyclase/predicted ATPase
MPVGQVEDDMKCSSCGEDNSERAKFCNRCGSALTPRCSTCGAGNMPGAKFCSECGARLNESAPASSSRSASPVGAAGATAERRHLTVMFCDLVGSTALSGRLDLEDLQEVIGAYHDQVAAVVRRFGGFVARRVGDGVLAYFGYPHIEEDDAEQAVRAGLAIISAIEHLKNPEPMQVRIGIATSLVVIDEVAKNQEVLGEGPNLAARLQALAEPNTIIIADSTRRLVGSVFEVEDRGLKPLKGFGKPQRAWRVLGESRFKSRFEALRSAETPLVGRGEEIDLLLRRWAQAKTGEGRVILLSAEPGIGKSRLTLAFMDRLGSEPYTYLRHFCWPHHEDSSFFPITVQLERAAGFGREDSPAEKLDKLETMLAATSPTGEDLALLADLLSLPTERYPMLDLNPRLKREKTFEALLRRLIALAKLKPVVMIVEDLHWVDPSTRRLLDLTIEWIERLPVLLIATFRPEFQPPWTGEPHVTTLTLSRLGRRESEAVVRHLTAGAGELSDGVVEEIVERADGVPLFLEEVTKAVLETGANAVRTREIVPTMPGASFSVPPALHASLMARLERLGPGAKEIAQIGATIGREFPYELLAIVAQRPEPELKSELGRLVEAELIFQRGEPPRSDFLFKHALVRDATYGTLVRGLRQQLHARTAQALEEMSSDTAATRPEVIARHLSEAGLGERAIVYWQRAGDLALRRSAAGEALTHLTSALRILGGLPDSQERARRELNIRLGLGTALNIARGSSDPEAAEHSARAVTLARGLDDDKQLFRALWGSWYVKSNSGQTEQALPLANELFGVAERLNDQDLMLEAYHSRWATSHLLGLNSATAADTARGIALYDQSRHHAHTYDYGGHDTGVCARAHRAMTLWITGFPDQAMRMSDAALELGRRLEHPPSLSHAAWWSAALQQFLRNPKACGELSELTMRIAREQASRIFMMCPVLLGWTLFDSGAVSAGLQHMEQAVTAKRQRVHRFYYDYELLVLAGALLENGEPDRALDTVEEALEFVKTSRNRVFEAEAQRLRGACLAALGAERATEAETWLLKAIETAKRQGALAFELRAATSLARAWGGQGRRAEAGDLLASVHARFTEGFDTPDLKDAGALLSTLGTGSGPR